MKSVCDLLEFSLDDSTGKKMCCRCSGFSEKYSGGFSFILFHLFAVSVYSNDDFG